MQTIHEMTKSGHHPNAPYMAESHLVGAYDISIACFLNNPVGYYEEPGNSEYVLTFNTKGTGYGEMDLGMGMRRGHHRKASTTLVAPGVATNYLINYRFDMLSVGLPLTLFETAQQVLGHSRAPDFEPLHADIFHDRFIEQTVKRMFIEASEQNPAGSLFVDHAAHTLVLTLYSLCDRIKKGFFSDKKLSEKQIGLVKDMMQAHIMKKLTLTDLANAIGFDVYNFSRAFRRTTGSTPHQYLISQRLSRAQNLLANTTMSLAEVAYECGFSSQSHFTSTFAKQMGVTPGAFRKQIKS